MLQRVLESLEDNIYLHEDDIITCICENPSLQCKIYCDVAKSVNFIFGELRNMIEECWSSDLRERAERVVHGLPVLTVPENHINVKFVYRICLSKPEVAQELCHLPCNKGQISQELHGTMFMFAPSAGSQHISITAEQALIPRCRLHMQYNSLRT